MMMAHLCFACQLKLMPFHVKALQTIAFLIAFATWTVQSLSSTQQRISDANQRIAIVESKLIRLDTDISVLSKHHTTGQENE